MLNMLTACERIEGAKGGVPKDDFGYVIHKQIEV